MVGVGEAVLEMLVFNLQKAIAFFFQGPSWQLWVVQVFLLVQTFHNQKFEDVHFLSKFSVEEKC